MFRCSLRYIGTSSITPNFLMIYQFNLIERILLNKNVIPHPVVDATVHVGLTKALATSVKVGLTDRLQKQFQSPQTLAKACDVDTKGATLLLNCLEALGYVTVSGAGYAYNKRGMKFLHPDSPANFKHFILFGDLLYESLHNLEQTIRDGEAAVNHLETYGDREWELYSLAMKELARNNIPEIMGKIKLFAPKRMLDLGGSHGLYSIALCKKHPELKATVMDFEAVRRHAEASIAADKLQDRVSFLAGDFIEDEFPGGNDLVLLMNIIHSYSPEQNKALFKRIHAALNAGGQMIVFDQVSGMGSKSQMSRAVVSYMAMNLFHQANGNTYARSAIESWAKEAGFKTIKLRKTHIPGCALISCTK